MNSTYSVTDYAAERALLIVQVDLYTAQDYGATASVVLMLWYYLTTLDQEVNMFWKRKFNGACALFFANRYLPLIVAIYDSPWWSLSTAYTGCASAVVWQFILEFSQYVVWACFSALRVYALRQQWTLALLTCVLSVVPVVANTISLRFLHISADPVQGCNTVVDIAPSLSQSLDVLSRSALVLADFVVVVTTWAVTRSYRNHNLVLGKVMSLSSVMYRNGSIYFVILTVLNILHLVFTLISLALADLPTDRASFLVRFIEPLTAILITQFLFDLQEAAYMAPPELSLPSGPGAGTISTLSFARADIESTLSKASEKHSTLRTFRSVERRWAEECIEALEEVQWKMVTS